MRITHTSNKHQHSRVKSYREQPRCQVLQFNITHLKHHCQQMLCVNARLGTLAAHVRVRVRVSTDGGLNMDAQLNKAFKS